MRLEGRKGRRVLRLQSLIPDLVSYSRLLSWRRLGKVIASSCLVDCMLMNVGPAPFLVILQFDTPGSELENLPFLPLREGIRRTRLYRTHWREKNSLPQQREPGFVPEYLALLEVETELMAEAFEAEKETFKAKVGSFRLVGAFGQVEVAY